MKCANKKYLLFLPLPKKQGWSDVNLKCVQATSGCATFIFYQYHKNWWNSWASETVTYGEDFMKMFYGYNQNKKHNTSWWT